MSTKQITIAKGGTAERTVDVDEIKIPDLWHIVQWLRKWPLLLDRREVDQILETWHLCHALKNHVAALPEESDD